MHYVTTVFYDAAPRPHPSIRTISMPAKGYAGYWTMKAYIAHAEQCGLLWLAFSTVPPRDTPYVHGEPQTTVILGTDCVSLSLDDRRNAIAYA